MDTSPSELILLDGTVSSVIYRNEENGYTILRLEAPEAGEEVTVVGTMPGISRGGPVRSRTVDPSQHLRGSSSGRRSWSGGCLWGKRPCWNTWPPGRWEGGVGAAMARRLLDAFGEDVLTVIEEAPRRLTEVKGISPNGRETIHQSLCMQLSMRRLLDFLSAHGSSSPGHAPVPAVWRPGSPPCGPTPTFSRRTPLHPFPAADKLARELGLEADDPLRLEAGLLYTLSHNLDNGHVFLPMPSF